MKIRVLILFALFFCWNSLLAQQQRDVTKKFESFSLKKDTLNGLEFYKIQMQEDMFTSNDVGRAMLPVCNTIVRVPKGAKLTVKEKVLLRDTIDLGNKKIYPLQRSRFKNDSLYHFDFDKEYYSHNTFSKDNHVKLVYKGTMRNEDIYICSLCPFRYNPAENKIEFVKEIDLHFDLLSQSGQIIFNTKASSATVNYTVDEPYKMVILTDEMFVPTLKNFIAWKNQQGYQTTVLTMQQFNNNQQTIKDYLSNLYYEDRTNLQGGFDYLLIVGDVSLVPTFDGKHPYSSYENQATDLYYATYTDDILPDVFYARMSCNDTSTLANILNKTIKYEKYDFSNNEDDFLDRSLLVAGVEASNNAPTYTNGQMNYLKNYFQLHSDTSVYYNPSSGQTGNVNQIRSKLSQGQGWVIYSAHGDVDGWYKPRFRSSSIDSVLNDSSMYGIFINNCCLSGSFNENQCFTVALLQANNKGAVGAIGAANYSLWSEDYHWSVGNKTVDLHANYNAEQLGPFDRFFHTHSEPREDYYLSMGQMLAAGNIAVMQSLSYYSDYYWEIYNLQADPTLIPYVGKAKRFEVNLPDTIHLGDTSLSFVCEPYTYACLSIKDSIISVYQADSTGNIHLNLSNLVDTAKAMIVLTNQFYRPLIKNIFIDRANMPFVALKDIKVTNSQTLEQTNNLQAGQSYNLSFKVINSGSTNIATNNNSVLVHCSNPFIDFSQNMISFSDIAIGQEIEFNNVLTFSVSALAEDNSVADIVLTTACTDYSSKSQNIKTKILSDDTRIHTLAIKTTDSIIELGVNMYNYGHFASGQGSLEIVSLRENLNVLTPIVSVDSVEVKSSYNAVILLSKNLQNYDSLHFTLKYTNGLKENQRSFAISLKEKIETFANGFSVFDWQMDSVHPWQEDDSIYYFDNILNYNDNKSVSSYRRLGDNSTSTLKLHLDLESSAMISFYVKVSSEAGYDEFHFLIDNDEQLVYSGNIDWRKESFVVAAGEHDLEFVYEKDMSYGDGYDAAWIDNFAICYALDTLVFSIEDVDKQNVTLYPNPTKDMLYFDGLSSHSSIKIFDQRGSLRFETISPNSSFALKTDFLSQGVYYVVLSNTQGVYSTKKVVVLR